MNICNALREKTLSMFSLSKYHAHSVFKYQIYIYKKKDVDSIQFKQHEFIEKFDLLHFNGHLD